MKYLRVCQFLEKMSRERGRTRRGALMTRRAGECIAAFAARQAVRGLITPSEAAQDINRLLFRELRQ